MAFNWDCPKRQRRTLLWRVKVKSQRQEDELVAKLEMKEGEEKAQPGHF